MRARAREFRAVGGLERLAQLFEIQVHRVARRVLRERLAPSLEFGREVADVVGGLLELPRVAAGEDAGAGRGALRVRRVGLAEEDAVAGDAVDVLDEGSDQLLLVYEDGRVLAAAYSYGASWCVDVTSLFQAQTA